MTVATQLLLCGISLKLLLTTEAHLETDSEAGLHDLTHRFIGEVSSNGCEQKGPQDLKQDSRVLRKTPVGCSAPDVGHLSGVTRGSCYTAPPARLRELTVAISMLVSLMIPGPMESCSHVSNPNLKP